MGGARKLPPSKAYLTYVVLSYRGVGTIARCSLRYGETRPQFTPMPSEVATDTVITVSTTSLTTRTHRTPLPNIMTGHVEDYEAKSDKGHDGLLAGLMIGRMDFAFSASLAQGFRYLVNTSFVRYAIHLPPCRHKAHIVLQ